MSCINERIFQLTEESLCPGLSLLLGACFLSGGWERRAGNILDLFSLSGAQGWNQDGLKITALKGAKNQSHLMSTNLNTPLWQLRCLQNWAKEVLIKELCPTEHADVVQVGGSGFDTGKWFVALLLQFSLFLAS